MDCRICGRVTDGIVQLVGGKSACLCVKHRNAWHVHIAPTALYRRRCLLDLEGRRMLAHGLDWDAGDWLDQSLAADAELFAEAVDWMKKYNTRTLAAKDEEAE